MNCVNSSKTTNNKYYLFARLELVQFSLVFPFLQSQQLQLERKLKESHSYRPPPQPGKHMHTQQKQTKDN